MRLLAVPLALVLAFLAASPAAAATFTVNRTDDVAGAAGCPQVCTLRAAVSAANASPGSTIQVPGGTYTFTSALPTITTSTAIAGDGITKTIISGSGNFRVFTLSA